MSDDYLRAPFPWYGGKSKAAAAIWQRLGRDLVNYIEPFAGSLAVLLGRPGGAGKIETINDLDCDVENFWRAVRYDPEGLAAACDYPVNEAAMHARHEWLVSGLAEHRELMHTNCYYYDVERAGWWVWGVALWIGSGWGSEPKNRKHPKLDGIGKGIHSNRGHRKIPNLAVGGAQGDAPGRGIHSNHGHRASSHWRQRPHMSGTHGGMGVHRPSLKQQLPDLGLGPRVTSGGRGIHKLKQQIPNLRVTDGATGVGIHTTGALGNLPSLGNDRGIHGVAAPPALEWFQTLQERLRRVRVACGDWERVVQPSILGKGKNVGGRRPCGIVFDPPYDDDLRTKALYANETKDVAKNVAEWCREHGDDPELRIALCGYEGEHEMPKNWSVYTWKGNRGYAKDGNENRFKETIWFSPHCLAQATLTDLWENS